MNADPQAPLAVLGRRVGIPRSSVYRLSDTLEKLGFLEHVGGTKGFRLRHTVRSLSEGYRDDDWVEAAWQEMIALGTKIFWPLCLFTLDGGTMLVRRTTHERSTMSIDYGMNGQRLPIAETAAGRAYLAFCPQGERQWLLNQDSVLAGTEPIQRQVLDHYLSEAQRLGYATRVGGLKAGTSSISVPITFDGKVVGCISVILIRSALPIERAGLELGPQLIDMAKRIAATVAGSAATRSA